MKKIYTIILTLALMFTMTACGNMQILDTTFTFDKAIVSLPNGEIVEGKVDSWRDYDGDQIQVVIDGTTYLVHSSNIALMASEEK